mmetsp:Transcript_18680/g.29897  ORF Transcript_18680/g.29897 Transcript_18680/m.29897 type:complete len:461 (-) Transcript_18680:501-1883(-)
MASAMAAFTASGLAAAVPLQSRARRCRNATAVCSSSASATAASFSARRPCRRAAAATAAARSPSVTFVDVVDEAVDDAGAAQKPFQAGMPDVTVFGVSHLTNSFEAAEHILRTKPRSVVVETALCKEHAAERGTAFNFAQIFAAIHVGGQTDADESLKFITRVAHQLRLEAHPLETSPFWENMKTQLPAEPLVYAAAFAVDARLVFGDRPKETTYRRLVSCPTLAELDQTFGNQSARNYRLLLPDGHPEAVLRPPAPGDAFETVCIAERDDILAHTIREEAARDGAPGAVVAVMGADHVAGVERKLSEMVASGGDGGAGEAELAALLQAPETAADDLGVRLAITQRLLGLRCTESLVADANAALDADLSALVGDDIIAFNATSEIYGSARMLLACVEDSALLDAVIGGVHRSDFGEVLAPMRDVRPSRGGRGWSQDALAWLRTAAGVDLSVLQGDGAGGK